MTLQVDRQMKRHRWIFSDPPAGSVARCDPEELVEVLRPQLDTVNAIGHDVIVTALALRVFEAMPELCTKAVCDGLARVIHSCRDFPLMNVADVFDIAPVDTGWDDLDVSSTGAMARVAMETAVGFEHVYVGTHQGNIGHIIALFDFLPLVDEKLATVAMACVRALVQGRRETQDKIGELDELGATRSRDVDARAAAHTRRLIVRNQ